MGKKLLGRIARTGLLLLAASSLEGCAATPPTPPITPPHIIPPGTYESREYYAQWYLHQEVTCNNYIVSFISDPPGAKIEVENNYVGQTPCSLRFHGTYSTTSVRMINAYPIQPGQFVQTKVFGPGEFYPRKIYFDMSLKPTPPSVDVNINKR